jgi:glycosyltransferase involved in cell wall biosynthesis
LIATSSETQRVPTAPSEARPLAVGLNLLYLVRDSGGSSTYARELVRAMLAVEPDTRITAFVSSEVPDGVLSADWAGAVEWVRLPVTVTHGPPGNFVLTTGLQWLGMPVLAARRRLDVIHGLANVTPLLAPRVATLVTLLDVIWLHHPDAMERRARVGMKMLAPISARRADRVITISEAARRDVIDTLGLDPAKVDVTHLGITADGLPEPIAPRELRERFGLSADPLVLCVAQKRPHKNLAALIEAVATARSRPQLVLPGTPTPYERELRELAGRLGAAERVHFPGWIDDGELEGLYRMATCFVLPSFQEGFGLPLLEAMRRGVPVACSNVSSLPEVVGDAALTFDPHRHAEIADAIDRLLEDGELRARLVDRGHERCAAFSWERTARATLASYRRALATRRRARGA